jgi:hypothetical protein
MGFFALFKFRINACLRKKAFLGFWVSPFLFITTGRNFPCIAETFELTRLCKSSSLFIDGVKEIIDDFEPDISFALYFLISYTLHVFCIHCFLYGSLSSRVK